MKCPRCHAGIVAAPDKGTSIVCPGCGARLRSRPSVPVDTPKAVATATDGESGRWRPAAPPAVDPNVTLPPGGGRRTLAVASADAGPAPVTSPPEPATLEILLAELRAMRGVQEEMLELLRLGSAALEPAVGVASFEDEPMELTRAPIRARRRKTVLLLDDDVQTRAAAVAALEAAEVPVRQVHDGNAALAAIAAEKPDVIVMELAMGGAMAGKDVINMIKATMEWVDIPVVLYTRVPIENQREARQTHGADDYVAKGKGAPEALVARVVALFRRS